VKRKKRQVRSSKRLPAAEPKRPARSPGADNTVGHGRPPKHTRFSKGRSGNPKGRPKGSKNLSTVIMDAARDKVTANIGGKQRQISKLQATAMQLATKAAGGDQGSIARFLDWVDEIEVRSTASRPVQFPFSQEDLQVLRLTYERMQHYQPGESDE